MSSLKPECSYRVPNFWYAKAFFSYKINVYINYISILVDVRLHEDRYEQMRLTIA